MDRSPGSTAGLDPCGSPSIISSTDGYLPSWIPVASAMAARTKRVRFTCHVCLLPFNHPIRLAEDLAVLDNIKRRPRRDRRRHGLRAHRVPRLRLPVSRRVSLTDEASPC